MTAGLARIGVVFGCLAGAMAFLIAYDENVHHFAKREARRRAAGAAAGAFVFFTALALGLAVVIPRVVHP